MKAERAAGHDGDDGPDTPLRSAQHSSAEWVLGLLFVGNLLSFYDRALPAVVLQQIKVEFSLDDLEVGALGSAFVLVLAVGAIPLGRVADRVARAKVAGWGLVVWSLFTATAAVVSTFWLFFVSRVGVGIGEASYAPASGSLISDLYPAQRRARAWSVFMLGFPIGTLLAFFTVGALAGAFSSWRAPFLLAGIPGLVVAVLILRIREPRRGAMDPEATRPGTGRSPLLELRRVRSLMGLAIAFAGYNFAAYAIGTFLTSLLQRSYGLGLVQAATLSGVVIGVMGLLGLLVGGTLCDRAARHSPAARALVGGVALLTAAPLAYTGLSAGPASLWQFVAFLSMAYLSSIVYLAASTPVLADVVHPQQRASALGVVFAVGYLLGGAAGPLTVGLLSDALARSSGRTGPAATAQGLQGTMTILVPVAFGVAALGMFFASRTVAADHAAIL